MSECDCCGEKDRVLSQIWVTGMETWACDECRGAEIEYGVWCEVFGGRTGHREAWLKCDGEIFSTFNKEEAVARAKQLNELPRSSTATFSYKVRQL